MVHLHTEFFPNKYLYYFCSEVGRPQKQRAQCVHRPTPLYTGDLSIRGFWNPQGTRGRRILKPIPCRFQRKTKVWGSQKLHKDFQLHKGSAPPTKFRGHKWIFKYSSISNNPELFWVPQALFMIWWQNMIHCLIPKTRLLYPSNDSNLEGSWHHSFLDQLWKLSQLTAPYVYQLMLQVSVFSLPYLLISHKSPSVLHQKEKNVWATFTANRRLILNRQGPEQY